VGEGDGVGEEDGVGEGVDVEVYGRRVLDLVLVIITGGFCGGHDYIRLLETNPFHSQQRRRRTFKVALRPHFLLHAPAAALAQ
jgi:hypothetical protein